MHDDDTEIGWTITIEVEGQHLDTIPDEIVDHFVELMAEYDGSVRISEDSYGATFSVTRRDGATCTENAVGAGLDCFAMAAKEAGMPDLPVSVLEARTFTVHDAELEQPVIPELVSVSEIASILGVSRQRAHQLTKRPDFPEPIAQLGAGPIWTRPSLNLFLERWRADKPDVTAELAQIDEELEELRRIRNQIAHGTATPDAALQFATTTAKAINIIAGTLGVELKYEDIVNVGGAVTPEPAQKR